MATEFKLPELGEGIDSGDVLEVFVSEGDVVSKNQPILELETDKASVEVPSKVEGTIVKIHVAKGQTVAIGAVILTVEGGGSAAPAAAAPAAEPAPPAAPEPAPAPAPEPPAPQVETPPAPAAPAQPSPPSAPPAPAPAAPVATPAPAVAPTQSTGAVAPAGPAIRRLAREVGVDLSTVVGSGEGGRITRDDIMSVVRGNGAKENVAAPAAPAPAASAAADAAPAQPAPAAAPASVDAESDAWGPIHIEPMTKIRKTISAKMHESWSTVPRVTNFDDADVTELEDIRQASKKDYLERGIKLTQMPFLIKAVAMALKTNPAINASIDEENAQIIYKKYVNVGIAVDTDRGLLVPSLRGADKLSIPETARALGTIGDNARANNFKLDDLRGSTFTISNLGAIGGQYSTPIVNTPEVAILLVGRSRKMPVVVNDEVVVRLMMPLSLSYDHRLVDGATAARFLNDVISYLQSPSRLLIAP